MKLRTTLLTGTFATLIVAASCSGGGRKKVLFTGDSGAGEAGAPSGGGAGAGAGAGTTSAGGMGGVTSEPDASVAGAGSPDVAGASAGGEAGAGPVQKQPLLLFTVDANAVGLAATGVAAASNPQSTIFGSGTANADPITGTNVAVIRATQLGIADTDTIDAFAAIQKTPVHPVYGFSVASGFENSEGQRPTRLNRSSQDQEAIGDVYFSDGKLSFRNLGEGGDQLGYNGLIADEQSIGLSPIGVEQHEDNLTGVALLPDGILPTELYFSVSADSEGLVGSSVAATTAADRGCTVFKSKLDGRNTVAFSCSDLGLATASDVKGLTVYGATKPSEVLFTLDVTSNGLTGTAVENATNIPSHIFASPLDGTNTLRVTGTALGLATTDALDALAVFDRAPPSYGYSSTCQLTPSPTTPEGAGLDQFYSARPLGTDLLLIEGSATVDAASSNGIGAYNVKTCALVARATLTGGGLQGRAWAAVPGAGWSAASPLKKLEYWQLESNAAAVDRLDATGSVLGSYPLGNLATGGYTGFSLAYDAVNDRFFAVLEPSTGLGDYVRAAFGRPPSSKANGTTLNVLTTPIPHPCAYSPLGEGVDSNGNSIYVQHDTSNGYRVCALTPSGEFADLPFTWTLKSGATDWSMVVPGDALYAVYPFNQFTVDRHAILP